MEMQLSQAVYFDSKCQNMQQNCETKSLEPVPKKPKSDFTFQCIVCDAVYGDLDVMYEHMKVNHPEMYAQSNQQQLVSGIDNGNADSNVEHYYELSDEEYLDLSRLLEPICELRLIDDNDLHILCKDENDSENIEDPKKFHLQQLQIQMRLNELRKTNTINGRPIVLPRGPGRGRRREIPIEMNNKRQSPPPPESCLFQCTQCESSFIFAGDLAKHVRCHTQNKPYQCAICEHCFTHIASLTTHIRIHLGIKPYKCKYKSCSKEFTQKSSLMVHERSHSQRKPHQCEICDKGFVNSSSLILHLKSHADGDPNYLCNVCNKRFKTAIVLAEHQRTHSDTYLYQCSICHQSYEQSGELVQHMKKHFGEKPFACSICSRFFTQPGSLNTHMRIHTGERPFSCSKCNKQFVQASSLSVHMRLHGTK